jgi:hypothetical protein
MGKWLQAHTDSIEKALPSSLIFSIEKAFSSLLHLSVCLSLSRSLIFDLSLFDFHGTGMTKEGDCAWCSAGKYQTRVGLVAEANCTWCVAGKYQSGTGRDERESGRGGKRERERGRERETERERERKREKERERVSEKKR